MSHTKKRGHTSMRPDTHLWNRHECAVTHKRAHPSRRSAKRHLLSLVGSQPRENQQVYRCPHCNFWHVGRNRWVGRVAAGKDAS